MSHKGNPDRPRAARYILKDYVNVSFVFTCISVGFNVVLHKHAHLHINRFTLTQMDTHHRYLEVDTHHRYLLDHMLMFV